MIKLHNNLAKFTCTRVDANPSMDESRDMDHWRCTITRNRRRMQLVFSKGLGHKGAEPTLVEVLSCLVMDSSYSDDFSEFCSELGYDEDSRKAERNHRQLVRQNKRFRVLFTDEEIDAMREQAE